MLAASAEASTLLTSPSTEWWTHMSSFTTPLKYEFKDLKNPKNKHKGELDVQVIFDPHCYTSEKKAGDNRDTLVTDHYDDGSHKERALLLRI